MMVLLNRQEIQDRISGQNGEFETHEVETLVELSGSNSPSSMMGVASENAVFDWAWHALNRCDVDKMSTLLLDGFRADFHGMVGIGL